MAEANDGVKAVGAGLLLFLLFLGWLLKDD